MSDTQSGAAAPVVNVEEVLGRSRYGGLPLLVTVLGLLSLTLDGFDIQAVAFAAPALAEVWQVSRASLGQVLAAGLIGMAVGALALGRFADLHGRRRAMLISTLIYTVGSLLCAYSRDLAELSLWRFITGLGLGAPLAIASSMINEFTPRRWRSLSLAAAVVGIPLGGVFGSALAAELVPRFGWPSIFVAGAILPALLLAALWRWFPESPKYLATRADRAPQLAALLNRLSGAAQFHAGQRFVASAEEAQPRQRFVDLLAPALRTTTLTLWVAFLCNIIAVYVYFNWLPTVLGSVGLPVAAAIRGSLLFNLGGVAGALVGAGLINLIGSRRVTILLGIVSILATFLIGQDRAFRGESGGEAGVALVWLMTLAGFGINGMQTQLYVLAASAFPTPLRATGLGSCAALGRIGGILSTGAGSLMFALGLSGGSFFAALAAMLLPTLLAMLLFRHHLRRLQG